VGTSLAIAAPPLLALLLLLWSLDRTGGRSGWVLLLSVIWGGLGATGLVTLVSATWLEQPAWYPYLVTPVVEETAKALLFVVLVALRRVPGTPVGLIYGLACGLGFALWENAAYFDGLGTAPTPWLYLMRTTGTALLHASATALVGAAAGIGGMQTAWWRRVLALLVALLVACLVHGSWNYVCLVLSDTSTLRRILPAAGVALLLALLAWSMLRERWHLRHEILLLWQEGVIPETVARAMIRHWTVRALKRAGVQYPSKVRKAVWRLALARRQLASLSEENQAARERLQQVALHWEDTIQALVRAGGQPPMDRSWIGHVAVIVGLAASVAGLHLLGQISPVPAALARRTVVVAASVTVRPEPLLSVVNEDDAYLLWQRGPTKERREQLLTWIGPGKEQKSLSLGKIPPRRADWFDMTSLGKGVLVATRHGQGLWLRSFLQNKQQGELRFDAPERDSEPCWPWLTSDRGQTMVGWDRLRHVAWLSPDPLALGRRLELPDPFVGIETDDQACARGFTLTDRTVYQVARPERASRFASIDLDALSDSAIDICPGQPDLRVHSLDKDRDEVLVLLGGKGPEGYRLLLARLDRSGHLRSPCEHVRTMPAGEPSVVSLAGAGNDAFLAWATTSHIFLGRFPMNERGGSARRWVLDRAPTDGSGVVRVGVTQGRLYVAWEGRARDERWSLKLLRSEIADLP